MFYEYYSLIFILQAFCAYHAYKNNAEQRWYWLIFFIPVVGCALYLYHNFYSRPNVQSITRGIQQVVNSNYKVEQLERALKFVDNYANKVNLADAYVEVGRYSEAIALYQDCLKSFMTDDADLQMKLLTACFHNRDFNAALELGKSLDKEKSFKNSESRVYYAWSLYHSGNAPAAEDVFKDLNRSFTNFKQRLQYCRYLKEVKKFDELTDLVKEMLDEFEHVKGPERKLHRPVINELHEIARTPISS